jgi:hypothetical protein
MLDELLTERLSNETMTCQFRTLSEVMAQQGVERIDLLKIDVEKKVSWRCCEALKKLTGPGSGR